MHQHYTHKQPYTGICAKKIDVLVTEYYLGLQLMNIFIIDKYYKYFIN